MSTTPSMLAYGTIDTQFGVTCEDRADGGITVTIPTTTWAYVKRRTPPSHPIVILFTIAWYFIEKFRDRPLPPRAVIELTAEQLSITEPDGEVASRTSTRTWPLREVGEVRPNRYAKGCTSAFRGRTTSTCSAISIGGWSRMSGIVCRRRWIGCVGMLGCRDDGMSG